MEFLRKKILLLLLLTLTAAVAQAHSKTEQLHHVIHNISRLRRNIKHTHYRQTTLQKQLRINETISGTVTKKLAQTKYRLAYETNIAKQLHKNRLYYLNKLRNQKNILAAQISATYIFSRQPYIKIILNNESSSKINRVLTYYKYLERTRVRNIHALTTTAHHIQTNEQASIKAAHKLQKLEQQLKQQYTHLHQLHTSRALLLKRIKRQLYSQRARLTKLISDKKNLEKIIAQLRAVSPVFATSLNKLRHKLRWPTQGRVSYLYGDQIKHSQLRWTGDLINAPQGRKVYAIAAGRVVFAKWLQGYGLLLIINHGHGYMSLYARNNSLYKKVGDIVARREVIATVGKSGGYDKPALYFAIRRNGKPINPRLWCN